MNEAVVTAECEGQKYYAVTNDKGIYAFANLPPSPINYVLTVCRAGYIFPIVLKLVSVEASIYGQDNCGNQWGVDFQASEFGPRIYVDRYAMADDDGSSWDNAFNDLQDALAAASQGTNIYVAKGTYRPDTGEYQTLGNVNATFQLKNGVALHGGFPTGGGSFLEQNIEENETILSGDIAFDNFSYHVVTGSGTNPSAVIDGFRIEDGKAVSGFGGGMYNDHGSPTVKRCTFYMNSADEGGGGMYNCDQSNPIVSECTFKCNESSQGGGMFNFGGSCPTVIDCVFHGNEVRVQGEGGGGMCNANIWTGDKLTVEGCEFIYNNTDFKGGGVLNLFCGPNSIIFKDCQFNVNEAEGNGGGIYNHVSCPILIDCNFVNNDGYSEGGGIYNYQSESIIERCNFSDNWGDYGGGIVNMDSSKTVLNECSFIHNRSYYGGGGIFNFGTGEVELNGCLFTNNSGDLGGGIWNGIQGLVISRGCTFIDNEADLFGGAMYSEVESSTEIFNCVFSGNTAGDKGGGVYGEPFLGLMHLVNCTFAGNHANRGGGAAVATDNVVDIENCVFWGNTHDGSGTAPAQLWGGEELLNLSYSCVQGLSEVVYGGIENIEDDPLFFDPQGLIGSNEDDLMLLRNSPCIDAGNPTHSYRNEPGDNGDRINMGAYGNTFRATPKTGSGLIGGLGLEKVLPVGIQSVANNKTSPTIYQCELLLLARNLKTSDVNDVVATIINSSDCVISVDDASAGFSLIETGQTTASTDTFTINVDRSVLLTGTGQITWEFSFYTPGGPQETETSMMSFTSEDLGFVDIPGDLTGEGIVNVYDLQLLVNNWLTNSPIADIAPQPNGDNFVDFRDFALFAENWLVGVTP